MRAPDVSLWLLGCLFVCFLFVIIDFILEGNVQFTEKLSSKVQRVPPYTLSTLSLTPLLYDHLVLVRVIWHHWWTNIDILLLPKVHGLHWSSLHVAQSLGFDKCVMTCVHHYSVISKSFMAPKSSGPHLFLSYPQSCRPWLIFLPSPQFSLFCIFLN